MRTIYKAILAMMAILAIIGQASGAGYFDSGAWWDHRFYSNGNMVTNAYYPSTGWAYTNYGGGNINFWYAGWQPASGYYFW